LTELPAGMLDGGAFCSPMAKKMSEQARLEALEGQLIDMTELALTSADSGRSTDEKLERAV